MFIQRLEELMKDKKITEYRLTQELNLSKSAIWNWKQGSQPSADKVVLLADFFEVSTDYLLGREAETGIIQANANLAPIEENILTLLRKLSKPDQYKVLGYIQALAS
jgi:transcriptional regulator with XRE-family HTH domain